MNSENLILVFQDEVHFQIQTTITSAWHKKAYRLIVTEQKAEYSDIRESAEFLLLPPYSHDLNPIEQVWRITRRENTHNVFFSSIDVLKATVDSAFQHSAAPNSKLRSLCGLK